ncbi:MAG: alanine--glyoxylate aminotransferase family protein, partial [Candidatus Heimdallarchaeota archaeon]|nr:alanine--glyoxylate aminotransferase family protein [Candidatus Heimdallarchaeota archaeon]
VKQEFEKNADIKFVTITHNETSTGVLNPLEEISKVVHDHGALLMADCITSAGGDLVEMDNWNIDIFVSGSQKCYGLPPGLAFIALSQAADERLNEVPRNNDFYSDLLQFREGVKKGDTPFTPPVSLFYGLNETLDIIHEEGMDKRIQRHRTMGMLYRNAIEAMGLELFAQPEFRSNTVTTAKVPDNVDSSKLSKVMLELGIMIAGGQGTMKGKIFRIGHMNLVGPRELLMIVAALEIALKKAGANISLSSGVSTIQQYLADQ